METHRAAPKLLTKVLPVYPAEAAAPHVQGDVVMDVTLKADGSLQDVEVIRGDPLLANAATDAVRQWKYRSLVVKGKAMNRFVVVLTFDKQGKAH